MRLVGGQSAYEGRVEVCLSQRWGTVTDDGWSKDYVQVVCRQLGYNSLGIYKFRFMQWCYFVVAPILSVSLICRCNILLISVFWPRNRTNTYGEGLVFWP